jgi:hypothetical protein
MTVGSHLRPAPPAAALGARRPGDGLPLRPPASPVRYSIRFPPGRLSSTGPADPRIRREQ